jgi:glycerophosphoryl diester phosphodiesterase
MTLVIAHRGASAAHPPGNTVEAFRTARAMGADWVELDARPTVDGALVVHHDAHLPDGRLVADLTVDELPGWVPTLATALDACEGMGVNVEIKVDEPVTGSPRQAEMVDAVVEVLVGAGSPTSRFLVTSFDWSVPARVRERAPGLPTGLLGFDRNTAPAIVDAAAAGGHATINPWDGLVTPELVARAHGAGLAVHVWTVDDPDRIRELVAMEADGVITNVPDVARALMRGTYA